MKRVLKSSQYEDMHVSAVNSILGGPEGLSSIITPLCRKVEKSCAPTTFRPYIATVIRFYTALYNLVYYTRGRHISQKQNCSRTPVYTYY